MPLIGSEKEFESCILALWKVVVFLGSPDIGHYGEHKGKGSNDLETHISPEC